MTPALLMALLTAQAADLAVRCVAGCEPGGDATVNLLYRRDAQTQVTLEWWTPEDPTTMGPILLRAGDPVKTERLPDLGELTFERDGALWRARAEFSGEQVGGGTFLTVVLTGQGRDQRILDWRVWRSLTTAERARQVASPAPFDGWELGIAPMALRIENSGRSLPRGTQSGKYEAWWSLSSVNDLTNLDLDGPAAGAPGVGVVVSPVWASRADDPSWRDRLTDALMDREGVQAVSYGDLEWDEVLTRKVEAPSGETVELRAFYAAVTLYTNASVNELDRGEVLRKAWRCGDECYTHETSANLREPDDPRLWAAYEPRELSQDDSLLELLARQRRNEGAIPGLPGLTTAGGDGGPTQVDLVLNAALRPWDGHGTRPPWIVAIDVVGARMGIGEIHSDSRETLPALPRLMAGLLNRKVEHVVDLADLPDGWESWGAQAELLTRTGALQPLGELTLAQKGLGMAGGRPAGGDGASPASPEARASGPDALQVPLSARLRAGALVRQARFGRAADIVPVNAYAQFVVRLTVAAAKELVVATGPLVPDKTEMGSSTQVNKTEQEKSPLPSWVNWSLVVVAGLVGLGLVAYLLAQVRKIAKVLRPHSEAGPDRQPEPRRGGGRDDD